MAYNVTVYKFSKRKNSTKQPTGSEAQETFACKLNDGSGVLNPTFLFDFRNVLVNEPQDFNYAYVAEFNRYYFIQDWSYNLGLWQCKMLVDVLASWKTAIGSVSTYIRYSSYDTSKRFPDDRFPIATQNTITNTMNAGNFTGNIDNGCFVLGIIGSGGSGSNGAVNYYVCSKTVLKIIIRKLFENTNWLNITDISDDLQKALFNPIQYVVSCMYFPFAMSNISSKTATTSIQFGWWQMTGVSLQELYILDSAPHVELGFTMSIPKHPDAASRGLHMNLTPYTNYYLMYLPYGTFSLDTTILVNYRTLICAQTIDLITGRGTMFLSCYNETTEANDQFDVREAQIAVPVQLAQMSQDMLNALGSVTNIAASAILGSTQGIFGGSVDLVKSMLPKLEIVGSAGGFNTYNLNVILQAQFCTAGPDNATIFGNPTFQNGTISSYPGYIEAEPGNNSIPCYEAELTEINSYFSSGFYYE